MVKTCDFILDRSLLLVDVVQCGIEFAAEHVLPLLFPLLTAQQLNVQQFAKYMLFVRDILRYCMFKHATLLES